MKEQVGTQTEGDGGDDQDLDATREKLERIRLHMDHEFSKLKRSALVKSSEEYQEHKRASEESLRRLGKEYLLPGIDERHDDLQIRIGALEHVPVYDLEFINSTLRLLEDFTKRDLALALIKSEYAVRKLKVCAETNRLEEKVRTKFHMSRASRLMKAKEELIQAKALIDKDRRARRRGAMKANAESYAMKQDVFKWLDQNFEQFGVLDSATDAIVKANLVPAKWRTIRGWCTEWKKLRNASGL